MLEVPERPKKEKTPVPVLNVPWKSRYKTVADLNAESAILQYWNEIITGGINAGKWIRLLFEVILQGLTDHRWLWNQKLADNALNFIERYCHHYKGKLAPQRIKLSLWERAVISLIFGIVDAQARRQFAEVLLVIGRKMGKTLLVAAIATYMAYAAGEYGSEIFFLAPKGDLADLCYSALEYNVHAEPELEAITKSTKYRGLVIGETNTTIKKLAFSSKKSDGYSPQFYAADEGASWPGVAGIRQWEVMVSGTGAREEPLGMLFSSGGYENDGIFDEMMKRGTGFLMGHSGEEHLLPIIFMIDDPEKWDDLEELEKSLPGMGESVSRDFIRREITTAHESIPKEIEFKTKYCNLKQNLSTAWLRAEDINKMFGWRKPMEELKNKYVVGGFDLSQVVDITAAGFICEIDGTLWTKAHFWIPKNRLEEATKRDGVPYEIYIRKGFLSLSGEEFVDNNDVLKWFMDLVKTYKIYPLMVGYDRWSAMELVQAMTAKHFKCDSVTQGFNLSNVADTFEGLLREGKIRDMDDNDLLKIHLADSAMKMENAAERAHPRKMLVKISNKAHVDGTAMLLDAMAMRVFNWDKLGSRLENRRRKRTTETQG